MSTFDTHGNLHGSDGKFEPQHRGEGDVDDLTTRPRPTPEQIAEALGDGPVLSEDEKRVLDILTDPDNHEFSGVGDPDDPAGTLDEIGEFGDDGDWYGVERIADLLDAQSVRTTDMDNVGAFSFTLNRSGEYEVGSYTVGVGLGREIGAELSVTEDSKYLIADRYPELREATGLRKAVYIASTIDGDYQRARTKAKRLGLVPDPSAVRKSPWPETDDEKVAFVDWQYGVANGDTNASFRDWYENRGDEDDE